MPLFYTKLNWWFLKQMDCHVLFQKRWVYFRSGRIAGGDLDSQGPGNLACYTWWSLWSQTRLSDRSTTTMAKHVQFFPRQGKGNAFREGKWELRGGELVNKEPVAFHWVSPCQQGGVFLLPVLFCYVIGHKNSPFWFPSSIQLCICSFIYFNVRECCPKLS